MGSVSNVTYVRWQKDESRKMGPRPPLSDGHPMAHAPCALCGFQLANATRDLAFLVLGVQDEEDKKKVEEGRWVAAIAVVLHFECLKRYDTEEKLQNLASEFAPVNVQGTT